MKDWIDIERRAPSAWEELRRLFVRAAARPLLPLAASLVLALCAVATRRLPSYSARVVLRVVEGSVDAGAAPRANRYLLDHVQKVALSDGRLLTLIRAEGLYANLLKKGDRDAIDAIRDDTEVEVWRNYFLAAADPDALPRSAHIGVTYQSGDPELAQRVAGALARIIVDEQETARQQSSMAAAGAVIGTLATTETGLDQLVSEAARRGLGQRRGQGTKRTKAPMRGLEMEQLTRSVEGTQTVLREGGRAAGDLALSQHLEEARLGLRFEIIDQDPPRRPIPRARELLVLGLLVFALTLPLSAMSAGAFDPLVRDLDDVKRLDLVPLGEVILDEDGDPEAAAASEAPGPRADGAAETGESGATPRMDGHV